MARSKPVNIIADCNKPVRPVHDRIPVLLMVNERELCFEARSMGRSRSRTGACRRIVEIIGRAQVPVKRKPGTPRRRARRVSLKVFSCDEGVGVIGIRQRYLLDCNCFAAAVGQS